MKFYFTPRKEMHKAEGVRGHDVWWRMGVVVNVPGQIFLALSSERRKAEEKISSFLSLPHTDSPTDGRKCGQHFFLLREHNIYDVRKLVGFLDPLVRIL